MTSDAPVAGLVLAAGGGRRYGMPKALVEHGGSLLVERAVATASASGVACAARRSSATGVMPGMSTSRTSAASTRPGQPRRPSRPVRREEAMPVSQSGLASTVAPSRSAVRQTSTARAPRTTSTGSQAVRAVRTARSTSRLPSYSTSALGIP